MAKIIINHKDAIEMHRDFYDKDFEVVRMSVCGFLDYAILNIIDGGNWGTWEGLVSTDGEKITFTKCGAIAEGKITKSWELSKSDTVDIKQGMFTTKIDFKDKQKGLTTNLIELSARILTFYGIFFYRKKRVEFRTPNEFDNLKKFQDLLAK